MSDSNTIQDFIDRASDEIADEILSRALAKAASRARLPAVTPERVVTTDAEIVEVITQGPIAELRGQGSSPTSKRQRAFGYFAEGKSRRQVKFLLKLRASTAAKYAQEWNLHSRTGKKV